MKSRLSKEDKQYAWKLAKRGYTWGPIVFIDGVAYEHEYFLGHTLGPTKFSHKDVGIFFEEMEDRYG